VALNRPPYSLREAKATFACFKGIVMYEGIVDLGLEQGADKNRI
jgi:hypothetical protein